MSQCIVVNVVFLISVRSILVIIFRLLRSLSFRNEQCYFSSQHSLHLSTQKKIQIDFNELYMFCTVSWSVATPKKNERLVGLL